MTTPFPWHPLHWATIYFASEWVVRLVMLVYVPQRRAPAAARAWLLLIFLAPWPGLLLYLLIGRISIPRWRRQLEEKALEILRHADLEGRHKAVPPLPAEYGSVVELATRLGSFHPLRGNRVELLSDYDGAVARLVADIDGATRHVHLEFYIFAADATARRVAQAVVCAARRGVACRVLLDSVGAAEGLRHLAPEMEGAGVEVIRLLSAGRLGRRGGRFDLRNHRKLVVIDGLAGYVGSQNVCDRESRHPRTTNVELVARVSGPLVSHLQAVFLADRSVEEARPLPRPDAFPAHEAEGPVIAQIVPSGPGYRRENTLLLLLALLGAARRRVTLATPYLIPEESLIRAMQAAVLRGVDVRVVTPRVSNQLFIGLAQKSFYADLLEAGVRVFLYEPAFLHAKHVSVDGEIAMVGSSNIDVRSFALNAEISAIFYDREVAGALGRIEEGYFERSTELDRERWERRPVHRRTLENLARLADSLL